MSHVTTHVLDTAAGRPAAGVPVALEARHGSGWSRIADAVTDADGRAGSLGPDALPDGRYRIVFDTSTRSPFFPEVAIVFVVSGEQHYHVPLLLSPFGYSTYRGS